MKAEPGKGFIDALTLRFARNRHRHPTADWADVLARLQRSPDTLRSLLDMERTGGEPDVIGAADADGAYRFGDRRYGRVFVYHNGAQSYYAARGFRSALRV